MLERREYPSRRRDSTRWDGNARQTGIYIAVKSRGTKGSQEVREEKSREMGRIAKARVGSGERRSKGERRAPTRQTSNKSSSLKSNGVSET